MMADHQADHAKANADRHSQGRQVRRLRQASPDPSSHDALRCQRSPAQGNGLRQVRGGILGQHHRQGPAREAGLGRTLLARLA
jgi:hypothetical protein